MTDNRTIPKPIISRRLCRTIFVAGSIFSIAVFVSMFIPRGVPVNRLGVSLLMVTGIAAFALLNVVQEKYRTAPWTLVALGLAVAWVSTLIVFTGGPKSDFFPLFFLILILAGASAEKRWHVAVVATLVCLGYVSHLMFFNVMRDSLRDFLIVRVPV